MMGPERFSPEQLLDAIRRHLAARHICVLATCRADIPWAASSFYVSRDLDLYVCQGRNARTLENMRERLQIVAPEFTHHFSNPQQPVLRVRAEELAFADRPGGIYPRQRLVRRNGSWEFVEGRT